MRKILGTAACACALFFAQANEIAFAQTPEIKWEVLGRFRLLRFEEDFQWLAEQHKKAASILEAEQQLAKATAGRGWSRDFIESLCIDPNQNELPGTCDRGLRKDDDSRSRMAENYLAPSNHRVRITLSKVPANAKCAWTFIVSGKEEKRNDDCATFARRFPYGPETAVKVEIQSGGEKLEAATTIKVRDVLIVGLGDSIAAGEGNPDTPVPVSESGVCFDRPGTSQNFYRPSRDGYNGSTACPAVGAPDPGDGDNSESLRRERDTLNWMKHHAHWMSFQCHRSLYSYQIRTALMLAVKNEQIAVTVIPLACTGAEIAKGILSPQKASERYCRDLSKACRDTRNVRAQIDALTQAMESIRSVQKDRKIDLILLTVGANDLGFAELVANLMVTQGRERGTARLLSMLSDVPSARKILNNSLPDDFRKLRLALKPFAGNKLSSVVYVSYGHPVSPLAANGNCTPTSPGFDIHPAFKLDPNALKLTAEFVQKEMFSGLKNLATCGAGVCEDAETDRMSFTDTHQTLFQSHGLCAASANDPAFDRQCFRNHGETFVNLESNPLTCKQAASSFRAYHPRERWIRTPNDSYFTAMSFADGPTTPRDLHDAFWGITSAVYGGAIHPTAEGHAAMADAAYAEAVKVLGLK